MSEEFECDCGFKWFKGKSGHHQCGRFYMEKVDGLKQELLSAQAHIEVLAGELQFFVDRVDSGVARNKTTYARFKDVLAKFPDQSLAHVRAIQKENKSLTLALNTIKYHEELIDRENLSAWKIADSALAMIENANE